MIVNVMVLAPMVATATLFIVALTQLWNKSISTTIHAISVSSAIYFYAPCAPELSMGLILAGILFNMGRAVINTDADKFVKRTKCV